MGQAARVQDRAAVRAAGIAVANGQVLQGERAAGTFEYAAICSSPSVVAKTISVSVNQSNAHAALPIKILSTRLKEEAFHIRT